MAVDGADHEHQFPEEETPTGVRILFPCLLCGLAAADGLLAVTAERDDWIARFNKLPEIVARAEERGRLRAVASPSRMATDEEARVAGQRMIEKHRRSLEKLAEHKEPR